MAFGGSFGSELLRFDFRFDRRKLRLDEKDAEGICDGLAARLLAQFLSSAFSFSSSRKKKNSLDFFFPSTSRELARTLTLSFSHCTNFDDGPKFWLKIRRTSRDTDLRTLALGRVLACAHVGGIEMAFNVLNLFKLTIFRRPVYFSLL